jgi:hypothetical protein
MELLYSPARTGLYNWGGAAMELYSPARTGLYNWGGGLQWNYTVLHAQECITGGVAQDCITRQCSA